MIHESAAGAPCRGAPGGLRREAGDPVQGSAFPHSLEDGAESLRRSMQDGACACGREDLPFTGPVERSADRIPFHTLLKQINQTHGRGLEVECDGA